MRGILICKKIRGAAKNFWGSAANFKMFFLNPFLRSGLRRCPPHKRVLINSKTGETCLKCGNFNRFNAAQLIQGRNQYAINRNVAFSGCNYIEKPIPVSNCLKFARLNTLFRCKAKTSTFGVFSCMFSKGECRKGVISFLKVFNRTSIGRASCETVCF